MTNKKNTRKALLMSCLSLLLCVSMLIGTTFAWFTDSVSSTANKIIAGNLDVDVLYVDSEGNQTSIQDVDTLFNDVALWEPGAVAFENLTVVNEGTLALKYQLSINFTNENYVEDAEGNQYRLSQVLEVAIVPGGVPENMTRQQLMDYVNEKGISWNGLMDDFRIGELYPADNMPTDDPNAVSQYTYGVVIRWQPGPNDNDYNINNGKHVSDWENDPEKNFLHIDLGINLFATQLTYEEDSWDDQYDAAAQLVGAGSAKLGVGEVAIEIHARDTETGYKVGSVVVDKDSIADPNQHVTINYTPSEYAGNFTIAAGLEKKVVDISVTNLREGNNVPVKATIRLAKGMDPETVKLYHYDQEIPCTYNPETGYVTFETTSFSPFTAVYDAESVYVPPVTEEPDEGEEKPSDLPNANVVNAPQYENVALPWGSYGGWSPTEGKDSELEAAFIFTCLETPEEAANNPYAQWYCDFVVMLDRDLGENQLFLGGNYGSFGWVGFHNGELTLEAGTEVPLLSSVTTNPWTYLDVATYVGEFICGVGDVNDALAGATFTVMLRLTNPENEEEFYNVNVVTYTFGGTYNIAP